MIIVLRVLKYWPRSIIDQPLHTSRSRQPQRRWTAMPVAAREPSGKCGDASSVGVKPSICQVREAWMLSQQNFSEEKSPQSPTGGRPVKTGKPGQVETFTTSLTVWLCDSVTVCDSVTTLYKFVELYQQTVQGEAASWRCECPWWFCWHPWYPKSFQMKGKFTKLSNVIVWWSEGMCAFKPSRLTGIYPCWWQIIKKVVENWFPTPDTFSSTDLKLRENSLCSHFPIDNLWCLFLILLPNSGLQQKSVLIVNGGSRFLETWGQHISWESFPPHSLQLENSWKL